MDYGWLALLPPLVAIVLAIWTKQVIISLFLGIWMGSTILQGWNPLLGFLDSFSHHLIENSLADSWNIGIIVFCLVIGGMVGVIGKLGGTKAVANIVVQKAQNAKMTQLSAALLGVCMFIDDYANSMIVGNTMRPLTDSNRISREKLAYICDSTAAPVSSMVPISTWIAMELGLIAAGLSSVGIETNSLFVFFQSIPFRFYSLFSLALVFILIGSGKDYGAMLSAEIRARATGQVYEEGSSPMISVDSSILPEDGVDGSIWDMLIPIGIFIIVTIWGLYYNGHEAGKSIMASFGDADASIVLTWAAFTGSITAIILGSIKKVLPFSKGIDAFIGGMKSMLIAVSILALAFSLKSVISEMQLAEWLVASTKGILSGSVLPLLVFITAMVISFATGTAWGTNSILMPLVIPIAAGVSGASREVTPLILSTIGAVLTGAVFGDHCSPISDTTILSSSGAGSDHIAHVRTQIPYATTAAIVAGIVGFIPTGFGISPWISLLIGIAVLFGIVQYLGKKPEDFLGTHISN